MISIQSIFFWFFVCQIYKRCRNWAIFHYKSHIAFKRMCMTHEIDFSLKANIIFLYRKKTLWNACNTICTENKHWGTKYWITQGYDYTASLLTPWTPFTQQKFYCQGYFKCPLTSVCNRVLKHSQENLCESIHFFLWIEKLLHRKKEKKIC